jgi:uroporphyrinogen-III synthase
LAKTLLLTRPRSQSCAFARALAERLPGRFEPVIAPLMRIEPLDAPIELAGASALVFTSANGVEQFAARWRADGRTAYCVGEMTAAAARAAGIPAVSADGDVAALASLVAARHQTARGSVLHVRGAHAAGTLVADLRRRGIEARAAEIYRQTAIPIAGPAADRLAAGTIAVVSAFSPRTARLFAQQARAAHWPLAAATAVSLSAAADRALEPLGFARRCVAPSPGREGMLAALAAL